jgi:hypothetical protein
LDDFGVLTAINAVHNVNLRGGASFTGSFSKISSSLARSALVGADGGGGSVFSICAVVIGLLAD